MHRVRTREHAMHLLHRQGSRTGALLILLGLCWLALRSQPSRAHPGAHRASFGGTLLPLPDSAWVGLDGVFSIQDAIPFGETWLLLDGIAERVHVLDRRRGLTASFGGSGAGPGELQRPAAFALVNDTLWVADVTVNRLDAFTPDGAFVRRLRPHLPCQPAILDDMAPSAPALVLAVRCLGVLGPERHATRLDPSTGETSPLPWPTGTRPGTDEGPTRLVTIGGAVWGGAMLSPCLHVLLGPDAPPRCVEPADRVALPRGMVEARRSRADGPLSFRASDPPKRYYPYYLDVAEAMAGVLVSVTPESETQMVLKRWGPGPSETYRPPDGVAPFLSPDGMLLAEPVLDGVRVARTQLPEGWRR